MPRVSPDELQGYFDFVEMPEPKRAGAARAVGEYNRVFQQSASIQPYLRREKGPINRTAALRNWRGLVGHNRAVVKGALDDSGTISNLLHDLVRREVPCFDIRGALLLSPVDLVAFCMASRTPYFESLKLALIDSSNQVIHSEIVSIGSLSETTASAQMLLRVLKHVERTSPTKPTGFIFAHNHPSGITTPSGADNQFTARMEDLGYMLELPLVDHVITNGQTYFSYREAGLIRGQSPDQALSEIQPQAGRPTPRWQKLAPWELTPSNTLPEVGTPSLRAPYIETLHTADPGHHHALYLNAKHRLVAVERLPKGQGFDAITSHIMRSCGLHGSMEVALGFAPGRSGTPDLAERAAVQSIARPLINAGLRLVDVGMARPDYGVYSWAAAGLLPSLNFGAASFEPVEEEVEGACL